MSTHPNAILLAIIKPDDLARKTHRALLRREIAEGGDTDIAIGGTNYHTEVMESDYKDGYQISAPEGSIIIFDMVTYGYGDKIEWDKLQAQKERLAAWLDERATALHFSYKLYVTANYW